MSTKYSKQVTQQMALAEQFVRTIDNLKQRICGQVIEILLPVCKDEQQRERIMAGVTELFEVKMAHLQQL